MTSLTEYFAQIFILCQTPNFCYDLWWK